MFDFGFPFKFGFWGEVAKVEGTGREVSGIGMHDVKSTRNQVKKKILVCVVCVNKYTLFAIRYRKYPNILRIDWTQMLKQQGKILTVGASEQAKHISIHYALLFVQLYTFNTTSRTIWGGGSLSKAFTVHA